VAAYTVNPHGGRRWPNRNTRLLALRDAVMGRWGKMGADAAAVCYPAQQAAHSKQRAARQRSDS